MALVRIHLDDFLALVAATGGAHVMRDVILTAALACDKVVERERVMRTALVAPGARNLAFGKRPHDISP